MPKSIGAISSNPRLAAGTGFSLLEVLVVVALIGLFSLLVLTQGGWLNEERELDQYQARLHDTLELLHEQSLFAGALVGLRLRHDGWQPMIFDLQQQQFIALDQRHLRRQALPRQLGLHWQLDDDDEQEGLAALTAPLLSDDDEAPQPEMASEEGGRDDPQGEAQVMPQLFFFPSGETSPVTLTLYARDTEVQRKLQLSSRGRVTNPEQERL